MRKHGVVGKFVEFYGPGVSEVPLANRATIGNMSPEYGSTVSMFPIDDETSRYMRLTGRSEEQIALVEAYAKEQGMWHDPDHEPRYSEHLQLDLSTVVPSIAAPKRPLDRVAVSSARSALRSELSRMQNSELAAEREALAEQSFPASDAPSGSLPQIPTATAQVTFEDGSEHELDHGLVAIAAITSCTNTSNPSVMLAAALLAKYAVEKGLQRKPWVKTSLAPGSRVVTDYYEKADLTQYLDALGFNLVGYGCTTCIEIGRAHV